MKALSPLPRPEMEGNQSSAPQASSEPRPAPLGELIEATRTRLQAIELGPEATSERKDVGKILSSIRSEVEKFLSFTEQSWDKANSGVQFAKNAETLVKALLGPMESQSNETIQAYIRELQDISRNAYDETSRTAEMFLGGLGAIESILDDISNVVETIQSEQEQAQEATAKAERRSDEWNQTANRYSPENGTGPMRYLLSPISVIARSKQVANAAKTNVHKQQVARGERALETLRLAKDKTDDLTRRVIIISDYWSKMSVVLEDICGRVAALKHDNLLMGKLRILAPDLVQANTDFSFYKQELENLKSHLQAPAFGPPASVVDVTNDPSTSDDQASLPKQDERFTSSYSTPSASPSTSNTSHSSSDPSHNSTEEDISDPSPNLRRHSTPATNGATTSTSSGHSNAFQDSDTRTSEPDSTKPKLDSSKVPERAFSLPNPNVKRADKHPNSTATSTYSPPTKTSSGSAVETGNVGVSRQDDSKVKVADKSKPNNVPTTKSSADARSNVSKSDPPALKPKPSTTSTSPPKPPSKTPASSSSQPSSSHSTSGTKTAAPVPTSPSPPVVPTASTTSATTTVARDIVVPSGMIGKVVIVLRNFKTEYHDEISLVKGEYIHQIEPYPDDKDWWIGIAASDKRRKGAFPVDHVKVVQDPSIQQHKAESKVNPVKEDSSSQVLRDAPPSSSSLGSTTLENENINNHSTTNKPGTRSTPPMVSPAPASTSTSSSSFKSSLSVPENQSTEEKGQPMTTRLRYLVDKRLQTFVALPLHEMPISQEPDYMEAMMELASQYETEDHCSAGAIIGEEILHVQMSNPAPVHTDIIWTMEYLSRIYQRRGEYRKAGLMMEKILRHCIRLKGKGHLDTLQARENLAANYQLQRRYSEAEFIWTGLITISRNKHGGMDKETLRLMERLANMYEQGAIFESATTLRRFIFNALGQTLGLAHRDTQHAMKTLAVNLEARELWKEAAGYWKALSKGLERTVGADSEETIHAAACLENARTMYSSFW